MNFLASIAHFWLSFNKIKFWLLYWVKPYAWATIMGQPSRDVSLVFELKFRRKMFNMYKNRLENELFGFDCSFLAVFQQNQILVSLLGQTLRTARTGNLNATLLGEPEHEKSSRVDPSFHSPPPPPSPCPNVVPMVLPPPPPPPPQKTTPSPNGPGPTALKTSPLSPVPPLAINPI